MPWTVADVDKHNKGLSAKQKKRWVEIANNALQSCMDKGGKEETCAASAIRQANGTVKNNRETLIHVNIKAEGYHVTRRKYEGKDYLIVPVTMMVEGVHNGNHGPIFHGIDELGKIPASWDGMPIVVNHPEADGVAVSANSPEVLEEYAVGKVFGTFVDDMKLKAKAWIEELKLNDLCPEALEKINNGDPLEVSVGVFTEDIEEEGEWNGEAYTRIATNHRPDHLAILPDAVGACSLKDGCGLGINIDKATQEMFKTIRKSGFSVLEIGNHKATGYREKMDAVYATLQGMNKNDAYHYLEEMYDGNLIYSKSTKEGVKMYKQDYTFESGKIELVGDPVEVRRKVDYVVNINNNQKKEVKMAESCTPCVKKKVDELIANSQGRWTEDNRVFLETLEETVLDKLVPQVITKEVIKEKEVQVNVLSKEDQDALTAYKAEQKAKREQLIKDIQANSSKELWPDEALNGMDDKTLKRVFDSVKKEDIDYSINGAATVVVKASDEIEPLPPTGIKFNEPKK